MKNIIIIVICVFIALFMVGLLDENKNLKESLKENATTKIYYMGTTTKDVSVKELITLKCKDNGGDFRVSSLFGGAYCVKDLDTYEWNFELDNFTKNGLVELK